MRIEASDLRVFEFDYDLTFMVFFLTHDEKIYARYGGRCAEDPDSRQSLAGLRYTMQSVLAEHQAKAKRFAPQKKGAPLYMEDQVRRRRGGRCMHCHEAKEALYDKLSREGKWHSDLTFRYPPPGNLGLTLEVDRGNVVESVKPGSAAARSGLRKGDLLKTLNGVPMHSFGDAQFALDKAPMTGSIPITWHRAGELTKGRITLPKRWRRSDITWRASVQGLIASVRLEGDDLTTDEKKALGLAPKQLAFRQSKVVSKQAQKAGIRGGDIILGVDDQKLMTTAYNFHFYIETRYVKGDTLIVNLLRNGKPMRLRMKLE